ncbi:MAG: rane-flanked domain [Oscillospiraceae bacterium]|jgi:putative membrane protein|nr:rane-flanked domain [Oscillospiraceae bacterium]
MNGYKRQHPAKIFYLVSRRFWLMLIPLARGLVALRWDFYSWVRGAWFDILIVLFIGISAYLRWHCTYYKMESDHISIRTGILAKRNFCVPYEKSNVFLAEHKFFLRPFGAANLYLDTNAGGARKTDVSLTVPEKDCEQLFAAIKKDGGIKASYQPGMKRLVVFSIMFSSTLSGVIYIGTLLSQSGKLLGRSLQAMLFTAMTDVSKSLALKIPPVALGISLFLFAGWLFSFLSSLLRHIRFAVSRNGERLEISGGFFTKRNYIINSYGINYADLKQNLLSKLFSVMSINIGCSGYGKGKNEIPVLIPITTKSQALSSLKMLLPKSVPGGYGIKPRWDYILRFITMPAIFCILIPLASKKLFMMFPFLGSIIIFVCIMGEIPALWMLFIKLCAWVSTGIFFDEKNIILRYSYWYSFHTVIIPKEKIAKISISQNIFQIMSGACDVKIYPAGESPKPHMAIALNINALSDLLKASGLSFEKINNFRT